LFTSTYRSGGHAFHIHASIPPIFQHGFTCTVRISHDPGIFRGSASEHNTNKFRGHARGPWPLPPKIVNRLLELEYVDMSELVPDGWRYQGDDSSSSKCCHQQKRYRCGPVTDIILWEECFSSMVEVLVTAHREKTGQLL
jgi:hypothetical protein